MRNIGRLAIFIMATMMMTGVAQISERIRATRVVVFKQQRLMELSAGGKIIRYYKIALGGNPVGHKQSEGDERTPEGSYWLDWRNAKSAYHRSIHISYPNQADKNNAKARGQEPGGMIMIHGQPNYLPPFTTIPSLLDWTNGCIAVSNHEMDEIWALVPDHTVIEIKP